MKRRILNIFVLLLLSSVFAGCGNNYKKDIVGRWANEKNGNIVEFSQGGGYRSGLMSGRYWVEGSKVIMDVGRSNIEWEIVSLDKTTMKIKDGRIFNRTD